MLLSFWYNESMSETGLSPTGQEDPIYIAFYAIYLRQAQGMGVKKSVEEVDAFSYATYYRKVAQYPDVMEKARADAFSQAAHVRKAAEGLLLQRKAEFEILLQEKVAARAGKIVDNLLGIAEDGEDKDAIAAVRTVRDIAQGGFLFETSGQTQPKAGDYQPMPYDPHTQSLTDMKLTLPPGSTVHVQVPAEGDAAVPMENLSGS